MSIRVALPEDAFQIAKIHVESWQNTYRDFLPKKFLDDIDLKSKEQYWHNQIYHQALSVYVIDSESFLLGWAAFGADRDNPTSPKRLELHAIYLHPDFTNKGFGSSLLNYGIFDLRTKNKETLCVWVLEKNIPAINFYVKHGFDPKPKSYKVIQRGGMNLTEIKLERDIKDVREGI